MNANGSENSLIVKNIQAFLIFGSMTEEKSFPYFLLVFAGLVAQVVATAIFLYLLLQVAPPPRLGNFDDLRYVLEPAYSLIGIMILFLILAISKMTSIRNLTLGAILLQIIVLLVLRFIIWP